MSTKLSGPIVQVACLCDKVLREIDGTISIIRAIDTWTFENNDTNAPRVMPAQEVILHYLILVKAGEAKGRFTYSLELETPSGNRKPLGKIDASFTGGQNEGASLDFGLVLALEGEGLHWVNAYEEVPGVADFSKPIGRSPLQVIYRTKG